MNKYTNSGNKFWSTFCQLCSLQACNPQFYVLATCQVYDTHRRTKKLQHYDDYTQSSDKLKIIAQK